jgi:thioester reductase-like protein
MDFATLDDRPGLLLTGATGFLGGELLARLLARSDEQPVYTLVRARDGDEARQRLRRVTESLLGSDAPGAERAIAVAGDLTRPDLGMDGESRRWLADRVTRILHCAASVSFTLGLDGARAVNVVGTRRLLDFAELCLERGGLDCFTHVSTAYVAGTHAGSFAETDLDRGQSFRNAYERSKFETELMLRERGDSLPVQVLRPSIVVGDSTSGWTASFNVLYGPLRAFALGAYSAIPGRRSAPVDIVPVDFVADAALALHGRAGTTYHLTAGDSTTTVAELLELASGHLDRRPPRVVSPALYRNVVHPLLMRQGGQRTTRTLRRSEALFPYFSMRVRYDDTLARAALEPVGIQVPPLRSYFTRLMDFAVAARWGRRPMARQAHIPVLAA